MRSTTRHPITYTVLFILVSLLPACDSISTISIKDILENPRQFSDKELQIKGQVVDIFSLIFLKYFTLKDKTGEITVVTNKPLPKKGEIIKVKGKVPEAFSLGDQQLLVFVESEEYIWYGKKV